MADRIQFRRDTKANWASANPILLDGEIGYVSDSGSSEYKMGNGSDHWNDIPFHGFNGTVVQTTGTSQDSVMSQKATTDAINEKQIVSDFFINSINNSTTKAITINRNTGACADIGTNDHKTIIVPFRGVHKVKIQSAGSVNIYQVTALPVVGSNISLCTGESLPTSSTTSYIAETKSDIQYLLICLYAASTNSVTSFTVDGEDFTNGLLGVLGDISKSVKNRYFDDAGDVASKVLELYLQGLDSSKKYYMTLQYVNGSTGYVYTVRVFEKTTNTRVASYSSPSIPTVIKLDAYNGSGISGYAIIKMDSNDTELLQSGDINNHVVSNIENSPSLKYNGLSVNVVSDKIGSLDDLVDLSDSITWNAGYQQVYQYGTTDNYPQQIRIGSATGNYSNHKYSSPIKLEKGDIIIYEGAALRTIPTSACVCEVGVDADDNVIYRRSILNQLYLGSNVDYSQTYYRFVADRDMYVSCNIVSTAALKFRWYRSTILKDVVDNLLYRKSFYPYNEVIDLLEQCKQPEFLDSTDTSEGTLPGTRGNQTPQLTLLWFSDIHNDIVRFDRLLQFKKQYAGYGNLTFIDDIICTGDMTGSRYSNFDTNFLDLDGYDKVLKVIGNHDVYDANGVEPESDYGHIEYWATSEQKYKRYMKGMADDNSERNDISTWGVIQPSIGAGGYYPCYYYKDYQDQNVRLVVIDVMDRTSSGNNPAEVSWFESVLADARVRGLHVVVASHFAPRQSYYTTNKFACGFTCLADFQYGTIGTLISDYTNAVDEFIEAGGVFVTWLCGHMHYDQVGTMTNHPKQLYMVIAQAKQTYVNSHRSREAGQDSEDLFNIVAVDTYRKHIRVVRIGSHFDRYLQHAGTMCISYDGAGTNTPHLLSSW